jgi:hypothetical protein
VKLLTFASLALLACTPAFSQIDSGTVRLSTHTAAEISQHEAKLMEAAKAAKTGFATEVFDESGTSRTLLVVRVHTGEAEKHAAWADQVVMLKGSATLVTGTAMHGEHPNGTAAGETLAESIDNPKEIVLKPGDIAHIPAGMPHWMKIAPGTTATYLAFKEK